MWTIRGGSNSKRELKKRKAYTTELVWKTCSLLGEEDSITFAHSLLKCGGSLLFGKDSSDQKCFPLLDFTFWLLSCFLSFQVNRFFSPRQTRFQVDFSLNLLGLLGPATAMTALLCRLLSRGSSQLLGRRCFGLSSSMCLPNSVVAPSRTLNVGWEWCSGF